MVIKSSYHSDEELLGRLSDNDKEAFAEIYYRYWECLLGMAYNRLKNLQAAEDVVHDVFAAIWINRNRQEIQSLRNYLATAVKYRILKEARKAALARTYQQGERPTFYTADMDAALDHKRILEILHKEVEILPEKCKLVYHYSRDRGMTVRDIAEKLHISPKTVENQLNKALRRLRLTLKNLPFFFF